MVTVFAAADIVVVASPAIIFASRCLGLNLYEIMAKCRSLFSCCNQAPIALNDLVSIAGVALILTSCSDLANYKHVALRIVGNCRESLSFSLEVICICDLNAAEILLAYIAVPLIGHTSVLYAVLIHVRIVALLEQLHCISMGVVQAIEALAVNVVIAVRAVLCCLIAKAMASLVTLDKYAVLVASKIVHYIRIIVVAIHKVGIGSATDSQGVSRLNSCFPNELLVNELASENKAIIYILSIGYECILILVIEVGRCELSENSSLLCIGQAAQHVVSTIFVKVAFKDKLRLTALVANSVAPAPILAGGLLNDSELSVDVANLCDVAYSDRIGRTSAANCAVANSDARLLAGSCLKNFVLKGVTTVKADVFLICERCNYSIKNLAAVVADLDIKAGLLLCSVVFDADFCDALVRMSKYRHQLPER